MAQVVATCISENKGERKSQSNPVSYASVFRCRTWWSIGRDSWVLFRIIPVVLKPTALTLNILESTVATACFARAGHFNWRLFWPFAITSVPSSFIGGYISLPPDLYKPLVGVVLLLSFFC